MKTIRLSFLALLVGATLLLSYHIYQQEKLNQIYTDDLIELSNIKYGLFNVDKWKSVFANVIASKINDFTLENTDEKVLKKEIMAFLNKAIDDFEKKFTESSTGGIAGFFRKSISSMSGIFDQVKKEIPVFTDQIYDFLISGDSQEMLRQYLETQLDAYTKDTFLTTDYTTLNNIVKKYNGKDKTDTIAIITEKIVQNNVNKEYYHYTLLVVFMIIVFIILFLKNTNNITFLLFTSYALILLFLGVFLPMIAIDARISELNFPFLGENIQFKDQVLFYKSKSIMEVVELMIAQNRIDLFFVGGLVFLFSAAFPLSKLITSIIYIYNHQLQNNSVIRFMVFKTGKWSMADVFVIAIFMAYLGFDGLITEQLNQLQALTGSNAVLTTNNSSLLFGFYAFTCFVLLSLFLSEKMKRR